MHERTPVEQGFEDLGRATIVEAAPGCARRLWLEEGLRQAQERGARTWLLSCRFADGGPWAGIHDLFASLIEEVRVQRPELLKKHDYELVHVLPELKKVLEVRNPTLTDLAPPEEKVRNYPADRVFRIVHGLIDLLDRWKGKSEEPWVLACDDFHAISHIGRRFFRELMRRRGARLRITLIAVVEPGQGDEAAGWLAPSSLGSRLSLDLPGGPEPQVDRAEAARQAQELEDRIGLDRLEIQIHLPELIRLWRQAGQPGKVAKWQFWGLEIFNTLGFYEDAIVYGESARAYFREHRAERSDLRWSIFVKLFMSYVALQQPEAAHRLAHEDVIGKLEDPEQNARLSYLLAMLHSRYMPSRDLRTGEELLERGLESLKKANMTEEEFHFQSVFNRNGLAMVRHFQGRFDEAMELCRQGYEELEAHLTAERHRLHRSVLLYNIAQVYTALGAHEEGLKHFSLAMEMDPHYSEYFNDRGNVYLKLRRFEEACADYLKAIELSPPYFEVYTNLGQCYRAMGRVNDAFRAYSISLDLEPAQTLALVGRAQCWEALGRVSEAIADYTAALALDPDQWDALASRAVACYEAGDLEASLEDLNRAVELSPDRADLYQNRAVALADLGRLAEAARDLETYLSLSPEAEDREEVAARLRSMTAALPPSSGLGAQPGLGA